MTEDIRVVAGLGKITDVIRVLSRGCFLKMERIEREKLYNLFFT